MVLVLLLWISCHPPASCLLPDIEIYLEGEMQGGEDEEANPGGAGIERRHEGVLEWWAVIGSSLTKCPLVGSRDGLHGNLPPVFRDA